MSEHPRILFGGLLLLAAVCASALAVALLGLGVGGIAAVVSGFVSAIATCFLGTAHGGGVSLAALTAVLLALASLSAFGCALVGALRQQRLLRLLPLQRADDERLLAVARAAGLDAVWLLPARRPGAFCYGLRRPRVVVTRGLLERLEPLEQAAAIWHEAQHARAREPLRCLLVRLAAASFFWLPALADLADRYLLAKELQADRIAASRTSRRALAAALGHVAGPAPAGAVGLGELVGTRIDRLVDPTAALAAGWRRSRLAGTAASIGVSATLASFPVRLDPAACARLRLLLAGVVPAGLYGVAAAVMLCSLLALALAKAAHQPSTLPDRGAGRPRRRLRRR